MTGNYLEVGKGLPYRKICFQNYIGNNFGQDGSEDTFTGETEGRFHKRVCVLVPVFVPGEHANVPSFRLSREGVNREKLTVKKLIDNEMFFFHRLCPL